MPNKTIMIAALLAVLCASAHASPAAPRLYLATEPAAPYSMREGERVTGIAVDEVREIMSRAGIGQTIELLPWKRAYTAALERADGCVFSTTRTPEREHLFKWVGPTGEAQWLLMGRAGRKLQLRTLEDARGLRIGTYNGDARDQFLREHGFAVDPAPDDATNPRKLLLDRIDLWAASRGRGGSMLDESAWGGRIVPLLVFKRIRVYVACNPQVPDALVGRMNAALVAMKRAGVTRRIERSYDSEAAPR